MIRKADKVERVLDTLRLFKEDLKGQIDYRMHRADKMESPAELLDHARRIIELCGKVDGISYAISLLESD